MQKKPDLPPVEPLPLGRYRHYKGNEYEIIGVARHSETLEELVVYRALYGDHGLWSGNDPAGLDNAGLLWWNPNARGEDETGVVGNGMYELVDGGERYPAGKWPDTPAKLFDTAGAVTIYDQLPPDLTPKSYPPPAGSPAAGTGATG